MTGQNLLHKRVAPDVAELQEADERFKVRAPAEITFVLKQAAQSAQLFTAYLDGGSDFVLTSILAVLPESAEILLEPGPDRAGNRRFLAAETVLLTANLGQVQIKFAASGVRETQFNGRPAFRVALPKWLLRVQRRESYRIETPVTKPLICVIPLPEQGPGVHGEAVVLDISCGGVALRNDGNTLGLRIGNRYENCRIGLQDAGTLNVNLEVRNSFDTRLKNGASIRRFGCCFLNLTPAMEAVVNRYIMQLERLRNFRSGR